MRTKYYFDSTDVLYRAPGRGIGISSRELVFRENEIRNKNTNVLSRATVNSSLAAQYDIVYDLVLNYVMLHQVVLYNTKYSSTVSESTKVRQ